MKAKVIRQVVDFKANTKDIYETLMDEKKHALLVGDSAKIESKVGGKFSIYDGEIIGENIELIKNKKIVQKWRYNYPDWKEDKYSLLTIEIAENEAKKGYSTLTLTQTDVPESHIDEISEGWYEYYWNPLKKLFE